MQPKWGRSSKPGSVEIAERKVFNTYKYFPDDDPLLAHISRDEILHVKPLVPYLRDSDYFEIIGTYPVNRSIGNWVWDWRLDKTVSKNDPIQTCLLNFGLATPVAGFYHNYPIFKEQGLRLMRNFVSAFLKKSSLSQLLGDHGFDIIGVVNGR
jgi:hypothetical protein